MRHFTVSCLLAASALSVSLSGSESEDPLLSPLKEAVDVIIGDGSVKVVEKDTITLDINKPITVPDEVAQVATVLEQVMAGFEEIEEINFEVEVDTIGG